MKATTQLKARVKILVTLATMFFCCGVFAQQVVNIKIHNSSASNLNYVGFASSLINNTATITLYSDPDSVIAPASEKELQVLAQRGLDGYRGLYAQINYQINDAGSACDIAILATFDATGALTGLNAHGQILTPDAVDNSIANSFPLKPCSFFITVQDHMINIEK